MKTMAYLFAFVTILFTSSYAQKTYFISSSQGSDSNPGTYSQPWNTISKLNSVNFSPGDIIRFKRGDIFYDPTKALNINSSGTAENKIKFATYGSGNKPVIGDSILFQPTDEYVATVRIWGNYITLDSLFIRGGNNISNGESVGVEIYGNGVTIQNCEIAGGAKGQKNSNNGITISENSRNFKIYNNEVRNWCNGIFCYGDKDWNGIDSLYIGYNYVHDCWAMDLSDADGIRVTGDYGYVPGGVTDYKGRAFVEHNEVTQWGEDAMDFNGAAGLVVRYNHIHDVKTGIIRGDLAPNVFKPGGTDPSGPSWNMVFIGNIIHGVWQDQQNLPENGMFQNNVWASAPMVSGLIAYNIVYDVYGAGVQIHKTDVAPYNGSTIFQDSVVKIYNNTFITGSSAIQIWDNNFQVDIKNNICISGHKVLGHSYTYPYPRNATETSGIWHGTDVLDYSSTFTIRYDYGNKPAYVDANILIDESQGGSTIKNMSNSGELYVGTVKANYNDVNPFFVNENQNNYNISSQDAPGVNYGLSLGFSKDINGTPILGAPDVGAIEYNSPLQEGIRLNIRVLLEGPFINGNMLTDLLADNYISLTQPYKKDPWNYSGTESVTSIPTGVVDWILLELRSGTSSSTIVARRAAFVKYNGSVVDLDGTDEVSFNGVSNGNYYVVVMHRNHLSVMSTNAIPLSSNSPLYDFTTSPSKAYGTDALANLGGGKWGMYAGDSDTNGIINVLDYGNVSNFLFDTGYRLGDLDLNGVVNVLDYSKSSSNLLKSSQVPN